VNSSLKKSFQLLMLGLFFGLACSSSVEAQARGRRYAVLVGVDKYIQTQLRDLEYSQNDVSELEDVLKKAGFNRIVLMTQDKGAKDARFLPTALNIRSEVRDMLKGMQPDDLVLLAFSGHGVQFAGEVKSYFCPMDAVLKDRSSLISIEDVYTQLEKSAAGTKLMLVDACRNDPQASVSKSLAEVRLESVTRPQKIPTPTGISALYSCQGGQKSYEHPSLKHGIFFHQVIQGLRGQARLNGRNEVTWDSLIAYVKAEVPDQVKELISSGSEQSPERRGDIPPGVTLVKLSPGDLLDPGRLGRLEQNPHPEHVAGKTAELVPEMIFRWCPPGRLSMGSSIDELGRGEDEDDTTGPGGKLVEVTLTQGFWLTETEITQGQWERVMHTTPWKGQRWVKEENECAASYISHDAALSFCEKLTELERKERRLARGRMYALPSEAQWEYACRAGTSTQYSFGDDASNLAEFSWFFDNSLLSNEQHAHIVGMKQPNAWGFKDMHGNVSEWCADRYRENLTSGSDPRASSMGFFRVYRGGGWSDRASGCRSAVRYQIGSGFSLSNLGFRVAEVASGE
jgi:formylglycine-generating enzyme required for sulfatase activity